MDRSDTSKSNSDLMSSGRNNSSNVDRNLNNSSNWWWWPSAGRRFFFRDPDEPNTGIISSIPHHNRMLDDFFFPSSFPSWGGNFFYPFSNELRSNRFPEFNNSFFSDSIAPISRKSDYFGCFPRLDFHEDPKNFTLNVDLPGMQKDEVKVDVKNGVLSIQGEKKSENIVNEQNYHLQERCSGSFFRSVTLPQAAREDKIKANLQDGVLHVKIPKQENFDDGRHKVPIE